MDLKEIVSGKRVVKIGEEVLVLYKPSGEILEEAEIINAIKLEELLQKGLPSRLTIDFRIQKELAEIDIDVEVIDEQRVELTKRINDFAVNFPEIRQKDLLQNEPLFNGLVKKMSDKFSDEEVLVLSQIAIIDKVRAERYSQTAESFASIYKTKFILAHCVFDSDQERKFESIEELANYEDRDFLFILLEEWDKFLNDIPSDRWVEMPKLGKT